MARIEYEYTIDHHVTGRVRDRVVLLREFPEVDGIHETQIGNIQASWGETDIGLRYVNLDMQDSQPLLRHITEPQQTVIFQKDGRASLPGGLRFSLDDSENLPQPTVEEKVQYAMKQVPLGDMDSQSGSETDTDNKSIEPLDQPTPIRNLPVPETLSASDRSPRGGKSFSLGTKGSEFWAAIPGGTKNETTEEVAPEAEEMADDYLEKQFSKINKGGESYE